MLLFGTFINRRTTSTYRHQENAAAMVAMLTIKKVNGMLKKTKLKEELAKMIKWLKKNNLYLCASSCLTLILFSVTVTKQIQTKCSRLFIHTGII